MKLSDQTIALLENYTKINPHLTIHPGNCLKTVNITYTLYSSAHIEETFPSDFGIYDLKEFLSVLSMFKEPELTFEGDVLTITDLQDSNLRSRYYSADMSVLTKVKEISKNLPEAVATFELTDKAFKQLDRGAATLKLHDVRFVAEGSELKAVVYDGGKAQVNTVSVTLNSAYTGPAFDVHIKVDKMVLISGDYDCELISNKAILMRHKTLDLMYLISLDVDTTM